MEVHTRSFTTKETAKEYPARFGGLTFEFESPNPDKPSTIEEVLERFYVVPEGMSTETAAVWIVVGQGHTLGAQKAIKTLLGKEETVDGKKLSVWRDQSVEEVFAAVQAEVRAGRIPVPVEQGWYSEPKAPGKVKQLRERVVAAEEKAAKVDALRDGALSQFKSLPKALRGQYAELLVSQGIVTQEELDAIQ